MSVTTSENSTKEGGLRICVAKAGISENTTNEAISSLHFHITVALNNIPYEVVFISHYEGKVTVEDFRDNKRVQLLLGKEVLVPAKYLYSFIQTVFAKFYFVHSGCFLQK